MNHGWKILLRVGCLTGLLIVVVAWSMPTALAQDGVADESAGAVDEGVSLKVFDHFVSSGGYITWLVLIPLSMATIALIVEHSLSIRRRTIIPIEVVERLKADLAQKRYVDIVQFTATEPSVLSSAVHRGLAEASRGYAAMQNAVMEAIDERAARLMRKIEYLNVIGNVSPMIGLFGTVYGMIRLFASIKEAGGIPEPARIANDISLALVTTFWGLMVAIPALAVFAFFRNRIDELASDCAVTCERMLRTFDPAGGGQPPARIAPPASAPASPAPAAG